MGRTLIVVGLVIAAVGFAITLGLGRLPGDIVVRGKNTVFYFPVVTSILLSVLLTLVMWLFNRR